MSDLARSLHLQDLHCKWPHSSLNNHSTHVSCSTCDFVLSENLSMSELVCLIDRLRRRKIDLCNTSHHVVLTAHGYNLFLLNSSIRHHHHTNNNRHHHHSHCRHLRHSRPPPSAGLPKAMVRAAKRCPIVLRVSSRVILSCIKRLSVDQSLFNQ